MRVFLGITGASGAPYAARLVDALAAADCEVGVSASAAGVQVLATELYGDPRLPRDEVLARFTERAGGAATIYDPHDYSAPYASGSAPVDGYVVCPCSMATAGTIATGGEANLIHRAAGVALKEGRKLVLVPARDAALDDPSGEPAEAASGRRGHPLRRAGLLPRGRDDRRPGRLHRRPLPRPARPRHDSLVKPWGDE